MQLTIEPIWPLLRVVLAVAALVVLVLTTYPKRVRHLRPFDRRLLIGLRLTMVALLAIAMLRPVAHIRNEEPKKRFLLIVTDRSQ
ncbi:MAG: hypothetical protein IID45_14780, partial [Planctomycetes bacterium]|nr:hypothetical protein [Planctomycetota bacterium]